MKRWTLLLVVLSGCHRDRDLKICEYNPGYCADAAAEAESDSSSGDAVVDSEVDSSATDSGTDGSSDAAVDTEVDSSSTDTAAGDAGTDSPVETATDATVTDTAVADTAVADTAVADTAVADTAVADTMVADTATTDTAPPPDTCVCTPGEVVSVTGTCSGALEKKTKTCTSSCSWGADVCAIPKGWTKIADPPTGFEGRVVAAAASTGGEVFIHGGSLQPDGGGTAFADGAIYSIGKNAWTLLPTTGAPTARAGHTGVWNGLELVLWGGLNSSTYLNDGKIYSPLSKSWSGLPTAPIVGRHRHGAVWIASREEMVVWGGRTSAGDADDGAVYAASTNTWTALPAAPIAGRSLHVMAWTGTEVLVWGGVGTAGRLNDGALFNPVTRTWRSIAASPVAGRTFPGAATLADRFAFFGGADPGTLDNGATLTFADLKWTSIAAPPTAIFDPRSTPASWQSGSRLFVWSGLKEGGTPTAIGGGASYDLTTGTWQSMPTASAPLPRIYATLGAVSAGAIVWSGIGQPSGGLFETLTDGAIYVP